MKLGRATNYQRKQETNAGRMFMMVETSATGPLASHNPNAAPTAAMI